MFEAFDTRAYPKNSDVLLQMMQTRYEIATLLGYASWADYNAADKMAGRGQRIADFIQEVDAGGAHRLADREFAMLLAEKQKTDPKATEVGTTKSGHLRSCCGGRSTTSIRNRCGRICPYAQVKQGILDTAASLFGVTLPAGGGRAGLGPECRDVGCDRQRQS